MDEKDFEEFKELEDGVNKLKEDMEMLKRYEELLKKAKEQN